MPLRFIMLATLFLAAAGCSQRDKKPRLNESTVVGDWRSETAAPTADLQARHYALRLRADGLAELVRFAVGADSVVERGTWDGADSLLRIVVRSDAATARPTSVLLAIRGDRLGLVQFDTTAWGPVGPTFQRSR